MESKNIFIVEIKANCHDPQLIRDLLIEQKAEFKGEDHQVDSYFNVVEGRLKLREGKIENSLIYYNRVERQGLKESTVELVKLHHDQIESTQKLLTKLHGVKVVVDKKREIYFIDNVKFHIDEVKELGSFIEIEAINFDDQSKSFLEEQCKKYCTLFNIQNEDYIDCSYSDLILKLLS